MCIPRKTITRTELIVAIYEWVIALVKKERCLHSEVKAPERYDSNQMHLTSQLGNAVLGCKTWLLKMFLEISVSAHQSFMCVYCSYSWAQSGPSLVQWYKSGLEISYILPAHDIFYAKKEMHLSFCFCLSLKKCLFQFC